MGVVYGAMIDLCILSRLYRTVKVSSLCFPLLLRVCASVVARRQLNSATIFFVQLSELTTQLSETIGQAETRARDEGRLRSEVKRLQITAARCVMAYLGTVLPATR